MGRLFIAKEDIQTLIERLKEGCDEFIAPKKEHLSDVIFADTKEAGGELIDYEGNSVISPRAFLLPQTEALFEIKSIKDGKFFPIPDKKKRIFYGVRPCDIKALILMRSFFLDEFVDIPYKQKLENSTFIALSCNRLCSEEAFCCEMDAGPVAKEGYDLQLTAIGKGYLVDVGSEKGSRIIRNNKKLFAKPEPRDEKEALETLKCLAKGCKRIDFKKLAGMMNEDKIKPSVWDDIGLRCVVCSGCITLCPTCSCFSIADRVSGDSGIRLRYCDGCPYSGFTRMAGGSTPFPLHKDHIRRFFEHKLNYDVGRYGIPSCVGCARCINTCPGNISIRKFIEEVAK
jgi:formate hydrogenlyase subunit 6/NADH:ubiquinone oxidoreductase subunit I